MLEAEKGNETGCAGGARPDGGGKRATVPDTPPAANPAETSDAPSAAGEPQRIPTVGIVGLGLIGGSFAKAYARAGWHVLACDTDADTYELARIETVESMLDARSMRVCDLIVLAAYPEACLAWLREAAKGLDGTRGRTIVIDIAGVKGTLCDEAFALAERHAFSFVGTHPMAGTQFSGFAHARADLFEGAPMVLVPPACSDAERLVLLDRLTGLLAPLGFGRYALSTPADHDRVIAFTSQLAHVVSNAYVKSPTARRMDGVSAGSYRDLTRVAHLNPRMWAELMDANAGNMVFELDGIIAALAAYRDALAEGDRDRLEALLAEGDRIKRELEADEKRAHGKRPPA